MPARRDISPRPSRREAGIDPAAGLLVAVVLHVLAYYLADAIEPPERERDTPIVVEVVELEEPKKPDPPKPPPEIEKPPEPEPPKPPELAPPKPEVKPKKPPPKKAIDEPKPEPKPDPAPPAPPKRFELPPSSTVPAGSGGDVKVATGPGTSSGSNSGTPGGTGTKPGGTGTGTGNGGSGTGTSPGPPWQPKNDLYISQQPKPLRVPELECPAVTERQVSGTVVLLVQVQRDGKVRSAKVTQKMGFGCDEIASKALKKAKFAPAVGTDGKAADYELRYEYAFELRD